jgi:hypothetical protein
VEITATHVISEDPYNAAEARVSRTTDNGGETYFDWTVITNEGLMLAQDRSEIAEGEPTRSEVENYLYQHIAPPGGHRLEAQRSDRGCSLGSMTSMRRTASPAKTRA